MVNQYLSNPGSIESNLNYNDPNASLVQSLINLIKSQMVSNPVNYAPVGMYQSTFQQIQTNTNRRGMVEAAYAGINPIPVQLLQNLGVPSSFFVNQAGQPNSFARVTGDIFNSVMGQYASPFSSQGSYINNITDSLSGIGFGRSSYLRRSLGVGINQASSIYDQLMDATYSDPNRTIRRGAFGANEVMDIFRMGADRDLFMGSSVKDISKKTMQLSRLIDTSRNTFNITDPNQALNEALNLTGGDVPLSDIGQIQQTLQKVKDLSKTANISMEVLKQVISRGAEVGKQLNISGLSGAQITASSMNDFRVTSGVGGIDQKTLAMAGGTRAVELAIADSNIKAMAGQEFQQIAGFVGAFNKRGISTSQIMEQLQQGKSFTTTQYDSMYNQLTSFEKNKLLSTGMSEQAADILSRTNASEALRSEALQGTEFITTNSPDAIGGMTVDKINQRILLSTTGAVGGKRVESPFGDIISKVKSGTASAAELEAYKTQFMISGRNLFLDTGVDDRTANALAENSFVNATRKKDIGEYKSMVAKQQAIDGMKQDFLERTTSRSPLMERLLQGFGKGSVSSIFRSILPESTNTFNLNPNDPLSYMDALNIARDFTGSYRGMDVFQGLSNIFGGGITSKGQAQELINLMGSLDSDTPLSEKESALLEKRVGALADSGGIITLKDALAGDSMKHSGKVMSWLKTRSPESREKILKSIKKFQKSGLSISDLDEVRISQSEVDLFNKGELVDKKKMGLLQNLKDLTGSTTLNITDLLSSADNEVSERATALFGTEEQRTTQINKMLGEIEDVNNRYIAEDKKRRTAFTSGLHRKMVLSGSNKALSGSAEKGEEYIKTFLQGSLHMDSEELKTKVMQQGFVATAAELAEIASGINPAAGLGSQSELNDLAKAIENRVGSGVNRVALTDRIFSNQDVNLSGVTISDRDRLSLLGNADNILLGKASPLSSNLQGVVDNVRKQFGDKGIEQLLYNAQKEEIKRFEALAPPEEKQQNMMAEITEVLKDLLMYVKGVVSGQQAIKITS